MATEVDDLIVHGRLECRGALPVIARTALTQEAYTNFNLPVQDGRIWDAVQTLLTTAGSDDLGLTAGAHGTGIWYVTAGSLGSAGSTTRRARYSYLIPDNYVAGQLARFQFYAGITGSAPAVADVSCTIDLEAFKFGTNVLISGSDIVSTSATSMNSTTFASINFDLTVTSLSPGDILDLRVSITCNDAGTPAANVVPAFSKFLFQCATKG